jgi:hypothetical protein
MGWTTDDNGTRRFSSESDPAWGLTVWAHCPQQIYVDSPGDTEVNVGPEGIQVFGESISVYDVSGVRFTIPWEIVREIIRFQDSVQSSTSKC